MSIPEGPKKPPMLSDGALNQVPPDTFLAGKIITVQMSTMVTESDDIANQGCCLCQR